MIYNATQIGLSIEDFWMLSPILFYQLTEQYIEANNIDNQQEKIWYKEDL